VAEKRGDYSLGAVFLSKDKICVLDSTKELAVCNFDGSNLKKFTINQQSGTTKKGSGPTYAKVDMIFPAPLGKILVFTAEDGGNLALYDIAARKILHELPSLPDVKAVYWNAPNFTHAAIVTKTQLLIVNKNLEIVSQQRETAKIKTGCFDSDSQAFIYSTSTHLKYLFIGLEPGAKATGGTFKSSEEPLYACFFMKNQVFAFNRQGDLV